MNDKELTHDDFLQRLDIRDVLLDAGYRQNRRFGLRLSSFIRTDSEGSVSGATSSSSHSMGSAVASHPGRRNTTSFRSSRNTRIFLQNTMRA